MNWRGLSKAAQVMQIVSHSAGWQSWGHTLISDYIIDSKSQFCYLICHDKTMAHRI